MSIATNPNLAAFYRWLRRQPVKGWPGERLNQELLADMVMTNRAHLSQVLAGRRRGMHTWRRLVKVLPLEGLLLLQQCASWNNFAEKAYRRRFNLKAPAPRVMSFLP
jgi:hypothetical protein